MNIRKLCISMGATALTASGMVSAATARAADASIAFANYGGIRTWSPDRDEGLWVQDSRRKWYYAKFLGPCTGVQFALGLGFDTHPMGTFDKFSSVVVPREGRCALRSLTPSEGPPVKKKAAAATEPEEKN